MYAISADETPTLPGGNERLRYNQTSEIKSGNKARINFLHFTIGSLMLDSLKQMLSMEKVSVNLMYSRSMENNKFFQDMVKNYHTDCTSRHKKYFFIQQMSMGVALCRMPLSKDQYFMTIEASARRNFKKSVKQGFTFAPIDYNEHLDAVWDILRSAPVRQGNMPDEMLNNRPTPHSDPKSKSYYHDYPYFGVFSPEGKLVAYSSCLIAGELAMITDIYGHADYLEEGIVPMMIIEIGKWLYDHYPASIWFGYGTYFGAMENMRRFKRKFNFMPYRVKWIL